MINLCSMWDSAYHAKGLALASSIARWMPTVRLFVLALDEVVERDLRRRGLANVTVLGMAEFEDKPMQIARATRSWTEYIWTLTPSLPMHVLARYLDVIAIAYIDADCYLFATLDPLYAEVGNAPIAIIPHRWSPQHIERLKPNGLYNVSWVYFTLQEPALECLNEWRAQCLAWCYQQNDGARFADQGYLNDWAERYGAHVVQHLGANLAPWNQEQYAYRVNGHGLEISDGQRSDPLLFYHFHEFAHVDGRVTRRTNYPLCAEVAEQVYAVYERQIAVPLGII